ncbi:MAG: AAA family ATPase [Gemmatimonadetes bacterium]|jgi:CMP/dCMP kinase|nr:AAA family ATPase [Gemmatimonadota bacterium]MBT7860902.1 AAA family ATPase [Gemmatimonadota bacterium]
MSRLITISGLPGSGTSTLSKCLVESSGRPYVNAGQIFRDMAAEREMSLADFGGLAEENDEIDRRLDARMVELARQNPGAVLEGRVTGWMAHRHQLTALRIWIEADEVVRAGRVGSRDGQSAAAAVAAIREREASERTRYADHYGIDLASMDIYDLVLNSDATPAQQLLEQVTAALNEADSVGEKDES